MNLSFDYSEMYAGETFFNSGKMVVCCEKEYIEKGQDMTVGLSSEESLSSSSVVDCASDKYHLCPSYFAEMGEYQLLTAEKECYYSEVIRSSFESIICEIINADIELSGLRALQKKLSVYQSKDPALSPRNKFLLSVCAKLDQLVSRNSDLEQLLVLQHQVHSLRHELEVAKTIMVNSNLRLVVSIARYYIHNEMPFSDIIQEGNIGLMRAVFRFDARRGNRFSTYATWWIKQSITRALMDKTRTIRLPIHFIEKQKLYYRSVQNLRDDLRREPTLHEISRTSNISLVKITEILEGARDTISLETPAGEGDDVTLKDFIGTPSELSPDEELINKQRSEQIDKLLSTLNEREKFVLTLRYGLGNNPEQTLAEIGRQLQISRERVRQIAQQALTRLRHPIRVNIVADYMNS